MNLTSQELRQKFLDFFRSKDHAIIPSASLIPDNDPSVLFNTAGMQPLVPYLLGEPHPLGRRLADAQKCLRTDDIDKVGDTVHLTFFEMLGNWSLGDYFQEEAIAWSWEFLTASQWLGLPADHLAASVFAGDADAPFDRRSYELWQQVGLPDKRLAKLGKENNWWGLASHLGPCGPDTEVFYWTGPDPVPEVFDPNNPAWVEIWNNVFMAYNEQPDGSFIPLKQRNVDTGLGLERVLAVLNHEPDIYLSDLFQPVIAYLQKVSGRLYGSETRTFRIIADHLRASAFLLADEKAVTPSNKDQGYILRRLIRRAVRLVYNWPMPASEILSGVVEQIIVTMGEAYPELVRRHDFIISEITKEINKFNHTLDRGLKEFTRLVGDHHLISGADAFMLYQSYGFPLEMTKELAQEQGGIVDEAGFQEEMSRHQQLSRTAAAGKFKGGLADNSLATTRLHTAAHLLLQALRQVLGEGVYQRGSNITPERLRFDFSYPNKLTPEEIKQVEDIVNKQIALDLPVTCKEMSLQEARRAGAMGVFDAKYGERVKVYTIGSDRPFSQEICGGPHVQRTGELGHFRIIKEESSSAGVRRIKAILED
jgi:alanyl-tRNA synthetase